MASPKQLLIKESIAELRAIQRKSTELIAKRIAVLIELKKHEATGISKRALSALSGVNHNSITKWRNLYEQGGLQALLSHGRIGFKKSLFTPEEHLQLEKKLKDPTGGIRGYVELVDWVKTFLKKDMKYITVLKYVQRHFGAKIKVARKQHKKQDPDEVDLFKKKDLPNSVTMPLKAKKKATAP